MLIDIVALVLVVMAIWKGWRKGLILAVFSFLAFVIGLAAALKLSALAAEYLGSTVSVSQRWLPVLAFILVFVLVALLVRLGAKLIEGAVNIAMMGWLNRIGGIFFYILIYLFIYSVLLFYAGNLQLIKKPTMEASVSYDWIAPLGPRVIQGIGAVIPFFKDMFQELLIFFDQVSEQHQPA